MIVRCILSFAVLLSKGMMLLGQGSSSLVSVKVVDSSKVTYYLKTVLCDSFTCVIQGEEIIFYEKSFRVQNFELFSGADLGISNLSPIKFLIKKDKVIGHYNLNGKLLSHESLDPTLYQLPLLMRDKFNLEEFVHSQESKLIAGILCNKAFSLGPDGDTTIIWMQSDTVSNKSRSLFNLYFTKPPPLPILEFSIRNFRMGDDIFEELTYSIYQFKVGDFSNEFQLLKNYKLTSKEEIDAEMTEIQNRLSEELQKKKKKNN